MRIHAGLPGNNWNNHINKTPRLIKENKPGSSSSVTETDNPDFTCQHFDRSMALQEVS